MVHAEKVNIIERKYSFHYINMRLLSALTMWRFLYQLHDIPIWSESKLGSGASFLHQFVVIQKHHQLSPHPPPD